MTDYWVSKLFFALQHDPVNCLQRFGARVSIVNAGTTFVHLPFLAVRSKFTVFVGGNKISVFHMDPRHIGVQHAVLD